jgi:hypothetical protein
MAKITQHYGSRPTNSMSQKKRIWTAYATYMHMSQKRTSGYQHLSLLQKLSFWVSSFFSLGASVDDSFALGGGRAAVRYGCVEGVSPAASRRASTTRRTSTAAVSMVSSHSPSSGRLTCKRLLDVDHLARARLHEATLAPPRPLQAVLGLDLALALQVALVAGDNLDGRRLAVVNAVLLLHVDHLHEEVERVERVGRGDVVDEQEGVGLQVRGGPEAAVLLLAGRVGEHEVVGHAVDGARHRVRVLWRGMLAAEGAGRGGSRTDGRVVVGRPLASDQPQGDGALS